jgi:DNA-directed RNA polymerase subunit M/transcription elongation factor TFIIS
MQTCSKCKANMAPKVKLDGELAQILARLAAEAEEICWTCPKCGLERVARMKKSDVAEVTAYIRRQKKKWWQFWIR